MIIKEKIIFILIIFSILILPGCLGKDHLPKPSEGDFNGRVVDKETGEGVPGVKVSFGEGYSTVTDVSGYFSFAVLPPGNYQTLFESIWYNSLDIKINHVGKKDRITFQMTPLPFSGTIIYSSSYDKINKRDIFFLNSANRSTPVQYATATVSETFPVFLKGEEIIFQSDRNGNDDLFIYNFKEKTETPICNTLLNEQHPATDNKGEILVFKSNQTGGYKLHIYYLLTGKLVETPVNGDCPVISPDGKKIAYIDGNNKLWIYNISSETAQMVNHPGKTSNPSWSPDSSKLAVEWWVDKDFHRIAIIENEIVQPITFSYANSDQHKHPCWSSKEPIIFFSANIAYSSRDDIYAIRIDDALSKGNQAQLMMITGGKGEKDYPVWADWVYKKE